MIKKICHLFLFSLSSISGWLPAYASSIGQTLQVNTHFSSIIGTPTWLLIIRDTKTGLVLPYIFDIKDNDNFWVAFTAGRTYKVTASTLKFGPYAKINNFCHLENGVITDKSFFISLSGELSPNPKSSKCHVRKYLNSLPFPIASPAI